MPATEGVVMATNDPRPSSPSASLWQSLAFGLGASAPVATILAVGTITDSLDGLVKAAERLGWPAVFVALFSYGVWQTARAISSYLVPKFDGWFAEQSQLIATLREGHSDALSSLNGIADSQKGLADAQKELADGHVDVQGSLKNLATEMGRLASAQEQATRQHSLLLEGMAQFGCAAASGVVAGRHHLPMAEGQK